MHTFEPVYEHFLSKWRDLPITILEIGIGGEDHSPGGESLRTWYEYFPMAHIVGLDLFDKSALDSDRITTVICDQGARAALDEVVRDYGPFDVIIDDGSHLGHDVASSLFVLWSALQPGGLYIIEDLQTSYWPTYGGSSLAVMSRDTAVRWVKFAIDIVNRAEIPNQGYFPLGAGFDIDEVHCFHNIAVLRRAVDGEPKSAVLDETRRTQELVHDAASTGAIAETHQRLLADPGLFEKLLGAVSALGGVEAVLAQAEHLSRMRSASC